MNIDDLKSTIGAHKGLAMQNRFQVLITPPGGVLEGSITEDLSILCESCVLPGRTISTLDSQQVRQVIKIANGFTNDDLSFTFLLTQDYFIKKIFDRWLSQVIDFDDYRTKYQNEYSGDIEIHQLDKNHEPIYKIKIENAYPITVNSINLESTAENTISRVTVVMAFKNYKVIP